MGFSLAQGKEFKEMRVSNGCEKKVEKGRGRRRRLKWLRRGTRRGGSLPRQAHKEKKYHSRSTRLMGPASLYPLPTVESALSVYQCYRRRRQCTAPKVIYTNEPKSRSGDEDAGT